VKNRAYLSLGSNIQKERNLPRAVALLRAAGRLLAISHAYESEPVGRGDQPTFLNAAVLLETRLSGSELKQTIIADIEEQLGRVRDPLDKNAPRTIDVDVALWNEEVGEILGRPVPDPDILNFAHVAVPLAEIAPDLVHPRCGLTLAAIAQRLLARQPSLRIRADIILQPRLGQDEPPDRKPGP
jgi:2-amino-4-hydroxy-6-hydroxymethyldihydropteridine diphosphokinase